MANKAISTLAVGASVYLNVGGVRTEFLVVHQGLPSSLYDASCDGTWLLMKDCYTNRVWSDYSSNNYKIAAINTYLNGPFLGLFDSNIQGIIKQVKIPYVNGTGGASVASGADGLSCKVFLLGGCEVGLSSIGNVPSDGVKLDYFDSTVSTDTKRVANLNGSPIGWALRSADSNTSNTIWFITVRGSSNNYQSYANGSFGIRPALILPSTTLVDDSGNVVTVDLTAHKTLINGTAYTVQGGKCLVNGTVYDIKKGRTLIGGTGYDITFAPPFPRKGDLITMNLDGTDRLYRVLKIVDGTTVEVFRVQNLNEMVGYSSSAEYAGNRIDVALNQTYYNTLTTAAKNAIVAKDINQYSYASSNQWASGRASTFYYPANKWLRYHVGDRFVYALDLEDVEEYFDSKYTSNDLNTVFFQDYIGTSSDKRLWLRSMDTNHDDYAASILYGTYAVITGTPYYGQYGVQPAFQIDLSKIDFTIN